MYNVKIVNVKDWSIKFTVNGVTYLIKGVDDAWESCIALYRIDYSGNGHFKTERLFVSNKRTSYRPNPNLVSHNFYCDLKHGQTYSSIDIDKFLSACAYHGFCEKIGISEEDANHYLRLYRVKMLDDAISLHRSKIDELQTELIKMKKERFTLLFKDRIWEKDHEKNT